MDNPLFNFDNSYAKELEGLYVRVEGEDFAAPQILAFNNELAIELGIDPVALNTAEGAEWLSGKSAPAGASPLAMAYAGHQFGGFSPQLGDGRALLVGEIIDTSGKRRDLHLKGSGRTPFSRGGDGKAAIGPVLREYIIGEAMHALGVPTTRALAATLTGEEVNREGPLPGAVLARVASSHLRVGTFQFFASRQDNENLRKLADYAIARHDADLVDHDDKYVEFFKRVMNRQANLIAKWMGLGFVHGVMNTDNVAISGETIDYGPCAFIDGYKPDAVFSSIDHGGRYAYANQPAITQWNLTRFAETLLPLVNDDTDAAIATMTELLKEYPQIYADAYFDVMRRKLGLADALDSDTDLVNDLFSAMEGHDVDFTSFFRTLATNDDAKIGAHFNTPDRLDKWLVRWRDRNPNFDAMNAINPIYIPRNHLVEEALKNATNGDLKAFREMVEVLRNPYTEQTGKDVFAERAPDSFGEYCTFCGT